jgi:hypothetical protein
MIYFYFGLAAYLVVGLILTFVILPGPNKRRLSFRDVVTGAMFMPILFVILICFDLSEEAWARLLIILAFDPPEKMRPGPPKPVSRDLDHQ